MNTGRARNDHAFTLLELLVAVAILGILSGVAISASAEGGDMKSDLTARHILNAVTFGKVRAFSRRETHRIVFDVAANEIRVEDGQGQAVWNPLTNSPFVWDLKSGALLSADFGGDPYLEFGTLGENLHGGTVTVAYTGLTQTFTVSPVTGRVAVEEVGN